MSDMKKNKLTESARACLKNGRRLLNDAEYLELDETPTTAHFLCEIAQEEFAKAFLLALVVRDVVPWDRRILRTAKDNTCKQLLCIVMEYLSPDWDEWLDRCDAVILRREIAKLPQRVVDAINILRHEKLGRWVKHSWMWEEDPEYDQEALSVAEGKRDRLKQDSLYVRLASDGGIASEPSGYAPNAVRKEREQADRLARLTEDILEGEAHPVLDYEKVTKMFKVLFASIVEPSKE